MSRQWRPHTNGIHQLEQLFKLPKTALKMKYLFLSILSCLCILGCDDDDATTPLDGIQFRLENQTAFTLDNASLRFFFSGASQDYHNYGTLEPGEQTDYAQYPAAGSCSIDFVAINADNQDSLSFSSACLCICEVNEGLYTLEISSFRNGNEDRINTTIMED